MELTGKPSITSRLEKLSVLFGVLGALIGVAVLVGWAFDLPWLTAPGKPPIRPISALCHVLAGISLAAGLHAANGSPRKRLVQGLAILVFLIGTAVVLEYGFGWDLTIDRWLFADRLAGHWPAFPGRPAPQSALSMALVGAALWLLRTDTPRGKQAADLIAASILGLAYLALLGYAYDLKILYYVSSLAGMSLHTAIVLALFCSGILLTSPEQGLASPPTRDTPGGAALRQLIPGAVILPPLIGWLNLLGVKLGLYSSQVGVTATVIMVTGGAMALIWASALKLDETDADRRKAEEASRRTMAMLQAEQEVLPDGVLVVDEHEAVVGYNRRFLELWQIPSEQVLRQGAAMLLNYLLPKVRDSQAFRDRLRYLNEHPEELSHEEVQLLDGQILDAFSAPVRSPDGTYYGRVWFYRDITGMRAAIQEVAQKNAELESARELGKLKDAFISTISHEIRTPLSIIVGFTELMEGKTEENPLLRGITDGVRRLTDHLNSILDYSTLLGGTASLDLTETDMGEVIRFIEEAKVNDMRQCGRRVEIELAPDLPPIRCDFRRVCQILFELLKNAEKFTPPEGTIGIKVGQAGDRMRLEVWDTGQGFPPEAEPRVWEPFTRLDTEDSAFRGGLGLGLTIVRKLVELHEGTVSVESHPHEGTRVVIMLPIAGPKASEKKC